MIRLSYRCQERWTDFEPRGEGVRFCGRCRHEVHDLSVLTRAEAEALLKSSSVKPCVRVAYDEDGQPVFRRAPAMMGAALGMLLAGCSTPAPAPTGSAPAASASTAVHLPVLPANADPDDAASPEDAAAEAAPEAGTKARKSSAPTGPGHPKTWETGMML